VTKERRFTRCRQCCDFCDLATRSFHRRIDDRSVSELSVPKEYQSRSNSLINSDLRALLARSIVAREGNARALWRRTRDENGRKAHRDATRGEEKSPSGSGVGGGGRGGGDGPLK